MTPNSGGGAFPASGPASITIEVLRAEHASIARVLAAMRTLIEETRDRGADIVPLRTLLAYLDAFPEQLHHPKEERHLFARLAERTTEAYEVLGALRREHRANTGYLRALDEALSALDDAPAVHLASFARAFAHYDDFSRKHMRLEEEVLIPIALQSLTGDDWHEIDLVFASNLDPVRHAASPRELAAELAPVVLSLERMRRPRGASGT